MLNDYEIPQMDKQMVQMSQAIPPQILSQEEFELIQTLVNTA